jgi:hypothetical protein
MHRDQRERLSIFLPVAVAQKRDAGFNLDQALLGSG